jgi:hypothetical protein
MKSLFMFSVDVKWAYLLLLILSVWMIFWDFFLKIPKEQPEAVNLRRTDNTMAKRIKGKRTNNNLQNTTQRTKIKQHEIMIDKYHVDKIDPSNLQHRYNRHFYSFHGYYIPHLSYNHLKINSNYLVENIPNIFVPKILHIFNNLHRSFYKDPWLLTSWFAKGN